MFEQFFMGQNVSLEQLSENSIGGTFSVVACRNNLRNGEVRGQRVSKG